MFPAKRLNHCIEGGRGSSQFDNLCLEQFRLNMCHPSLAQVAWMGGCCVLLTIDTPLRLDTSDTRISNEVWWKSDHWDPFLGTFHRKLWASSHIILGQVNKPGTFIRLTMQLNGMPYIDHCSIAFEICFFNLGWLVCARLAIQIAATAKPPEESSQEKRLALLFMLRTHLVELDLWHHWLQDVSSDVAPVAELLRSWNFIFFAQGTEFQGNPYIIIF